MGSGFKDFTAGAVLTAAEVDGYLMRQTAMTFADASARNTALSGVLDEGMVAYLEDTNSITFYTGSAWIVIYSDWVSFTPAWANLTEGSATNVGRYKYTTSGLHVQATIQLAADSSVTGTVAVTIPNSVTSASGGINSVGCAYLSDAATRVYAEGCYAPSASTSITLVQGATGAGLVNATNPFTWTTNDIMAIDIVVAI